MPVFAADVLPDTAGRNLGSPMQRWNGFLQNLDVQGSVNYQPVQGANVGPSGVLYVSTLPVTASQNVTTGQNLSSCPVAAGLLNGVGKVLRGTMGGTYTTQAGQTPILTIVVDFGPIEIFRANTAPLNAAQSNNAWRAQWEFAVYVLGSAGQIGPSGVMDYQIVVGDYRAQSLISWNNAIAGSLDLGVPQDILCSCAFTTNTSPANLCTQNGLIVEILN